MERNAYGLDTSAPVASINDLDELSDQLAAVWKETMQKAMEEEDPIKWSKLQSELYGIDTARHVVNQFTSKMLRRMTME